MVQTPGTGWDRRNCGAVPCFQGSSRLKGVIESPVFGRLIDREKLFFLNIDTRILNTTFLPDAGKTGVVSAEDCDEPKQLVDRANNVGGH